MLSVAARIVFALLVLLPAAVHAEPFGFRAYQLPQHGSLQLSVPRSWNDQLRQRQQGAPPTILFTPEHGELFNVQITPLWPTAPDAVTPDMEKIKRTVTKAADDAQSQAAETAVVIQEIQGKTANGYYFAITDRAVGKSSPDDFKYKTQGMLGVGKLVLAFTILSNEGAESAVADALKMIKEARQVEATKH